MNLSVRPFSSRVTATITSLLLLIDIGSLAFGLTNTDPGTFDASLLPEDSDLLLDRPEYWVVSKDVANSPAQGTIF